MLDECGLVKLTGIVFRNAVGPLGASETLVLGRHGCLIYFTGKNHPLSSQLWAAVLAEAAAQPWQPKFGLTVGYSLFGLPGLPLLPAFRAGGRAPEVEGCHAS